jgi:hypothetical protein
MPIIDTVTEHFSRASQGFKEMADEGPVYEWLHICCEVALKKLDHYFKLAHKSPLYYTAMVMDPCLKYSSRSGPRLRKATEYHISKRPFLPSGDKRRIDRGKLHRPLSACLLYSRAQAPAQVHEGSNDEFRYDHKSIKYGTQMANLKDTAPRMLLRNSTCRIGRGWRKTSLTWSSLHWTIHCQFRHRSVRGPSAAQNLH